ncbi:MAG: hypothetical protein JO289_24870 [Xanthobacteraceae bacterium]|nr:hypothetical protein [Xanthobacteraceae bacterium]
MTDQDYDELSTKREMVRLLAKGAAAEQLDAAINACMDGRLNDEERRTVLIQTIYRSWYERLTKRPLAPGADFAAVQWQDVERMFRDVLAMVGAPRSSPPATSSDEKVESQSMAAPIARLAVAAPEPSPEPGSLDKTTEVDESTTLQHIRRALDESPPSPTSPEEKWGASLPGRVRLSLDGRALDR